MRSIARVALVHDDFTVVINQGELDGVKKGENYLVYKIGEEVFDPDTKESLGRIEIVRGKAKVTHVQERMATLTSIEKEYYTAPKRVIRRSPGIAMLGRDIIEEVEDDHKVEKIPLLSEIGDYAKPI